MTDRLAQGLPGTRQSLKGVGNELRVAGGRT
jgi:hypothetical protein